MSNRATDRVLGRSSEDLSEDEYLLLPKPACAGVTPLFFSPEVDGRNEKDRVRRENRCVIICSVCVWRVKCLRRAVALGEAHGVWGGMNEQQRRNFVAWLRADGFEGDTLPDGAAFSRVLLRYYAEIEKDEL